MKRILVLLLCLVITFLVSPVLGVDEPPDSLQPLPPSAFAYHLYDGFDIGSYYPAFDGVFQLWVTDGIEASWDSAGVAQFIESVMDNDSTNSEDVFPSVWNYFCYGDSNAAYAAIEVTIGYNTNVRVINLWLYDRGDFDCSGQYPPPECRGYSWWQNGTNDLTLNGTDKPIAEVARDAFAHELQHLCFAANYGSGTFPHVYGSVNESLSTLAEYIWRAWEVIPANIYDQSYDASIFRCEHCDPYSKYMVEQVWMGYLFDVFRGSEADPTDDLAYQWLRQKDVNGVGDITLESLAEILEDADYEWLDGDTGDERLQSLYQYFLVAKFCNAPDFVGDGRFGYDDFSPVSNLGFFLDLCDDYDPGATPQTPVDCPASPQGCPFYPNPVPPGHGGCWNVRILPPSYILGSSSENTMAEVSGIYRDGDDTPADTTDGDKSRDYIDVAIYGTDYIIFKAGNYFQDGDGHEFHFSLEGESPTPPTTNTEVKAWVIGYSSVEDTLQLHPEDIVFIEPVSIDPDSTSGSLIVTDFGRGIKSVVIAVTLVEKTPEALWPSVDDYFTYSYEYGVYTTEEHDATWKRDVFVFGDVVVGSGKELTIDSGTDVHMWPDDLSGGGGDTSRIELDVAGQLAVDGTAQNPVVFQSWDGSDETPDPGAWFGIWVSDGSKATIEHCTIRDAVTGLSTHRDMDISDCTIENCLDHGIAIAYADSVTIDGTTIRDCGDLGINLLQGTALKISNSTVTGCDVGIDAYSGARLYADSTEFTDNDQYGIWLEPGSLAETPTSSIQGCTIKHNNYGVLINGTTPATSYIRNSVINDNTVAGVWCYGSDNLVVVNDSICRNSKGILAQGSDIEIRRGGYVQHNDEGITCWYGSAAVVESTEVAYNDIGIIAQSSSNPDVGHESGGASTGYNMIHHNYPLHIKNLSTGVTIMAEMNWWRGEEPPSNRFYGSVDYDPWIDDETPPDIHYEEIPGLVAPFVAQEQALPTQYDLSYNYPNPFNPVTTFVFQVPPQGSDVELVIYNVAGQRVTSLVREYKSPGVYKVTWNGESERGGPVASGMYFVRMRAGSYKETRKIMLLK
ncbi:MAG: hypothetical protein H6Q78_55 [Candidatus Krumholzibacteriota bacterium]|nr:hypothetical protein [Candidatus Krumholzibacteriota bacterium]